MNIKPVAIDILLITASLLTIICSIGIGVMKDTYQKLQYSAGVAALGSPLLVVAIWIHDSDFQARIKATIVCFFLFFSNAVLTHATARAQRNREKGHWTLEPGDSDVERPSS